MKKIAFIITILAVFATAIIFNAPGVAFAQISAAECDRLFVETIDGLLDYEESNDAQIISTKEIVYDIYLEPLGYLYLFSVNSESGYAIAIYYENNYEVTEIYFNTVNPYGEYEGLYIYVSTFIYLVYNDGAYRDINTGIEINEDIIELLAEVAYCGGDSFTYTTESIYYTYRSENSYDMVRRHPAYIGFDGITNACAPITGGNIIGFYDRYYENLIPNFIPGTLMGQHYLYKLQDANVNQAIVNLYNYMETNSNGQGTTIPQFRNGMITYCSSKNRNITFTSCMSGGNLNYTTAKQQMEAGSPLAIFVDGYNVINLTLNAYYEGLDIMLSSFTHTMAGFGYKEITYTLTSGGQRLDRYIAVATGLSNRTQGYFNISHNTLIDEVYGVRIY